MSENFKNSFLFLKINISFKSYDQTIFNHWSVIDFLQWDVKSTSELDYKKVSTILQVPMVHIQAHLY